jgi:hypothetical protein
MINLSRGQAETAADSLRYKSISTFLGGELQGSRSNRYDRLSWKLGAFSLLTADYDAKTIGLNRWEEYLLSKAVTWVIQYSHVVQDIDAAMVYAAQQEALWAGHTIVRLSYPEILESVREPATTLYDNVISLQKSFASLYSS